MVASGITTVLDAVAIGDVRDGGDRLENLEKMINAVEETQNAGLTAPSTACICAVNCRTPPCRCLKSWSTAPSPWCRLWTTRWSTPVRQPRKYREYYQGKYQLSGEQIRFEEEQMALAAA